MVYIKDINPGTEVKLKEQGKAVKTQTNKAITESVARSSMLRSYFLVVLWVFSIC